MNFQNAHKNDLTDTELLQLFGRDPERAWGLFCDKYSNLVFTTLRRTGFDYDEAMERFVYVFEKLCEQDYRRLRSITYAGNEGDLAPWLRQVVKRLCVNWAWAENGRKRLFGFVADMPERQQRIFELHFWHGQTPLEIYETLRLEHDVSVEPADVFGTLETIFNRLSQKKLWRLFSGLNRTQRTLSLDYEDDETLFVMEPMASGDNPEQVLEKKETGEVLTRALENLSAREKLVIQFRYDEAMTLGEIARVLRLDEREAVNLHKSALYKLRKHL